MSGIFAHAWLLVACLYIVGSAAGPTEVSNTVYIKECESHSQCPEDRACEAFKCINPCVDHCGDNSECLIHQHTPFCGCKSGYTITGGVNCTKLPECETHDQCPADRACEAFQCIDPCEVLCGNNTFCETRHHLPNCQCSPGYIGNPLVNCEWPECDIHEDCLVNMSCIASKCVDPCRGRCGNNSECLVHQHIPNCACKLGHTGNALVNCVRRTKSYFIEDTQVMNFNESLEYCKNKRMRLATFDNEAEFKQLAETIKTTGIHYFYWVAGSDLAQRDVWRWHTTGREMAYLPWGPGEPNHLMYGGEEQHCVAVYRYSNGSVYISDRWCSESYRLICEY